MTGHKGNALDTQKLIEALPKFLRKIGSATNLDGKLTAADIQFALELALLGIQSLATEPLAQSQVQVGESATTLDPENHKQMVAYLSTIPSRLQAAPSGTQEAIPQQVVQWGPTVIFLVRLLGDLAKKAKEKKKS
jgi:hypothetical protein